MIQKIIKVGNSYAVTIQKRFMDSFSLMDGDVVDVLIDERNKKIVLNFNVDKDVYRVGKKILKKYKPPFKDLAKK